MMPEPIHLPTPAHTREAMQKAGWTLALDLTEGQHRNEEWAFFHRDVMKQATISLASWRVPQVQGNWEAITTGMAILNGAKGAQP